MQEYICSVHNYTKFSGNHISFYDIAQDALACGVDVVFTTDKNIYPVGHDQFYYKDRHRVLVLCGEELYDPLQSDAPHYLSIGIPKEQFNLIPSYSRDEIRILLSDPAETNGFRHFELVNAHDLLSEGIEKGLVSIRNRIKAFDQLLLSDLQCIGLAGTWSSKANGKFTYPELFSTVCNHLITGDELNGDMTHDKLMTLKALKNGNLFVALDGLANAKGFCFSAEGKNQSYIAFPGDMITMKNSITLKISIPEACTCKLIHNGKVIKEWQQCRQIPFTVYEPGYYRVECSLIRRRTSYDWIFSNPIYVRKG